MCLLKFSPFSGTESKAVQPLLRKEAKKGQKLDRKLEKIRNEEAFINLLSDLEFILVKDDRKIPPENQKCLENYKNSHIWVPTAPICSPFGYG